MFGCLIHLTIDYNEEITYPTTYFKNKENYYKFDKPERLFLNFIVLLSIVLWPIVLIILPFTDYKINNS